MLKILARQLQTRLRPFQRSSLSTSLIGSPRRLFSTDFRPFGESSRRQTFGSDFMAEATHEAKEKCAPSFKPGGEPTVETVNHVFALVRSANLDDVVGCILQGRIERHQHLDDLEEYAAAVDGISRDFPAWSTSRPLSFSPNWASRPQPSTPLCRDFVQVRWTGSTCWPHAMLRR